MKELETERLILRKIKIDDIDQIYENWASDKITNEYLDFNCHENKEQTEKMVNYWLEKYENNGYQWCIELKDSNNIIGIISGDTSHRYKCIEIGCGISSKFFNKGYATEALKEVINYLLNDCDFNIVEAIIPSKNIASIKLVEKCNMQKEAVLKNRYINKNTNEMNDLYIYSISKL